MSAGSRALIGRRGLWCDWEDFCFRCLRRALRRLRMGHNLPEGENALNARLFDELRIAARELASRSFSYPPIRCECPVQPYGVSDEDHRRLKATPDITWGYEDEREPDPLLATRDFVIECKRLRSPTAAGWIFTTHYAEDGISRFVDPMKRYGEGVNSAAMVGYWQDESVTILHSEVCNKARQAGLPALSRVSTKWRHKGVTELLHSFARSFPLSPFQLHHFWIDLT
jgi:hypothetical protein